MILARFETATSLGVDGASDFNGLHSRKHDDEVEFYAPSTCWHVLDGPLRSAFSA